ncbi:hypothetical protein BEP19_13620 [Ammoniphilus oxalaticus]|uniref:Transposase n=1 Tax=Ammoniphilus oxalaticus TaxID=66863 RepID=A0A419SED6_9BACL|nr:hypothetical protein [Ammoniphilus oxalaticus]RKD21673.1 hypothetical protein BEP19_13620 [Ammoniphilus oxalaticus]
MIGFSAEIKATTDVGSLLREKTKIKDSVTNPQLNWNSRMEMYKKVQMINRRIAELKSHK